MANARIAHIFPSNTATITASSEKAGFPATNLQDERPGKRWQGADGDLTDVRLDFDMGSAVRIQGLLLTETNLTPYATVKWQGNDIASFTSPDVDQDADASFVIRTLHNGQVTILPKVGHFLSAQAQHRHWRLMLSDALNPDNYLAAGNALMFSFLEPVVNITNQVRKVPTEPSIITGTVGGFPRTKRRTMFWTYEIDFGAPWVSRSQVEAWVAIYEQIGRRSAVVFAMDPEDHPTEETIYGVFEALGGVAHGFLDQWELSGIRIREVRRQTGDLPVLHQAASSVIHVPIENVGADTSLVAARSNLDVRVAGLRLAAVGGDVTVDLKHGTTSFFGAYTIHAGNRLFLPLLDVHDDADNVRENRYYYKTGENEALNLDVTPASSGTLAGDLWYYWKV